MPTTITDKPMATDRASTSTSHVKARPAVHDAPVRLEVIYDGDCTFCTVQAQRVAGHLGAGVTLVPSSSPHVVADLALASKAADALIVRDASGIEWVGADAVARLLRASPRLALLGHAMALPGIRHAARLGYRVIARVRHRLVRWV
jgi:predicted DCC family thiol-disulfide oxidoreductase YuxK